MNMFSVYQDSTGPSTTLTSLAFENHLRKALSCHLMKSSEESAYMINIQ